MYLWEVPTKQLLGRIIATAGPLPIFQHRKRELPPSSSRVGTARYSTSPGPNYSRNHANPCRPTAPSSAHCQLPVTMVRKPAQRQFRPARVYQTVTTLMDHRVQPGLKVQEPVWYRVVESIPPSEILTRPLPPQHKAANPRTRKPSRLFQPQSLVYEEDALRKQFYKDHPWELARPRMIIEMDGKDAQRFDWSTGLRQPGIALSGER
jgi:hypothetical protein